MFNQRSRTDDADQMVSLSPLMSNFGALLEGLTTVRGLNDPDDSAPYGNANPPKPLPSRADFKTEL